MNLSRHVPYESVVRLPIERDNHPRLNKLGQVIFQIAQNRNPDRALCQVREKEAVIAVERKEKYNFEIGGSTQDDLLVGGQEEMSIAGTVLNRPEAIPSNTNRRCKM